MADVVNPKFLAFLPLLSCLPVKASARLCPAGQCVQAVRAAVRPFQRRRLFGRPPVGRPAVLRYRLAVAADLIQ